MMFCFRNGNGSGREPVLLKKNWGLQNYTSLSDLCTYPELFAGKYCGCIFFLPSMHLWSITRWRDRMSLPSILQWRLAVQLKPTCHLPMASPAQPGGRTRGHGHEAPHCRTCTLLRVIDLQELLNNYRQKDLYACTFMYSYCFPRKNKYLWWT
jgi:hypothetical protein